MDIKGIVRLSETRFGSLSLINICTVKIGYVELMRVEELFVFLTYNKG